jgi:hypothetical protein
MVKLCGAKARTSGGQPCKHFAMKNGRCWLHGGKSTGAKTEEGRQRIVLARTKTGLKSKQAIADRRQARELMNATKEMLAGLLW